MTERTQCKGRVWQDYHYVACTHKAKPGTDYCGVHDPEAVKARAAKRNAKYEADAAARHAQYEAHTQMQIRAKAYPKLVEALKAIAQQEWSGARQLPHDTGGYCHPEGCQSPGIAQQVLQEIGETWTT